MSAALVSASSSSSSLKSVCVTCWAMPSSMPDTRNQGQKPVLAPCA
jgi:hypothetical protein